MRSEITDCFCGSNLIFFTCSFNLVFSFLFVCFMYDAQSLQKTLYITLLLCVNQCVFIFLNFYKPAKFIKASIVYNVIIFAQCRRNYFRYVFYIRNRYIFVLTMFNKFIVTRFLYISIRF